LQIGRKIEEGRMNFARTTLLGTLVAGFSLVSTAPEAEAQGHWVGDTPVFQSEIDRRNRLREAERANRRKTYSVTYPRYMKGGARPTIEPEKPPVVYFERKEQPGSIIIDTKGRKLYYMLSEKRAYAYPISVGRQGFTWTGTERISRVKSWPSWTPPPEMRRRQPGLPITVSGGVINPLGAKALYLGNSIYRIHGTNNVRSIGRASSSGCFRMMNKHVTHLATIARIGTKVRVVSSYSGVSESAPLSSIFSSFGFSDQPSPKKAAKSKKSKRSKRRKSGS
jgi:lipoprotein-anchoring transpeptidase ErfK/SrfK